MRLSAYFLPILKETPGEAEIVSHGLMLRAGMIRQTSAGIYAWLPLGLRVLQRITEIVRDEQERAGALEMLMPTIQPAELWKQSGRYGGYGREMLRIRDRHDREMLYGPTNEEMITQIFGQAVQSYRDMPRNLFHVQWKFRDEIRPRFGVMRGREFLMKDAYSFDVDPAAGRKSYQRMFVSYLRTFSRLGLHAIPMAADAGPIGGDMSHEFVILARTGESRVYCHRDLVSMTPPSDVDYDGDLEPLIGGWTSLYAATDDMHDPERFAAEVPADKRVVTRGIEVGHVFFFGSKYTDAMGVRVAGPGGELHSVASGSYGIGISRLAGGIIEAHHDDAGIIWPEQVAPFRVGLVNLKIDDPQVCAACGGIYEALQAQGCQTLYDDADARPGAKFSAMDLIGLPWQVLVGPRGLSRGLVEVKERATGIRTQMPPEQVSARFA